VIRLSVEGTTRPDESLKENQEVREGVYLAGALTKLQAGYAITSVAKTTNETVEIDGPMLRVTDVEPETLLGLSGDDTTGCYLDRPEVVLKRLRLEHLNEEERTELEKTCLEYRNRFHLPG
jgi:hypothetical protein